ncbi:MAG TPA: acyl-CoA dehydrogenase family protein [Mycobacteriales bacterium]|nr:acyl-CoA dehydrogenase family protein [Mycobacteriales bacterium]
MARLSAEEKQYVATVATFVDREVRPVARDLEHGNTFPAALIERMAALGVFGLVVPESYGGSAVSTPCFAAVAAELSRGWMSLAGAMGPHSVVCTLLAAYGTEEQKRHWLPRLATGEIRAAMALTEPGGGSDLQAMRTTATRQGDGSYLVRGSKTWITNGRRAGVIALLCKTNVDASPAHAGMSLVLVEPGDGFVVSRDLPKLGYKGVETCELSFDGYVAPADALLGAEEGRGFAQMMRGLELGRIQVASRAVGVAQAAVDDAVRYAQQRESFGKPIWEHQAVGHLLATMATKVEAARQLVQHAAEVYDSGERADLEAGMAKLFASETCLEVTADAMRVHGGYGYSPEFDVERYYRDAPLMVLGEGTNEIQKNVIARQLISRSRR